MSEWSSRILNHPINLRLDEIKGILNGISITPEDQPDVIEDIERLKEIATFIQMRIKQSNTILVAPSMLNSIDSSMQSMITEVNQFISNKNRAHLTNANTHADSALTNIYQLPLPLSIKDLEIAEDAVTSLRLRVRDYLKAIEDERRELTGSLSELSNKIDGTTLSFATKADEIEAAFSKQIEEKTSVVSEQIEKTNLTFSQQITQFNEEIKAQKTRLETIVNEYQQLFSKSEGNRSTNFDDAQESRTKKFYNLRDGFQQQYQEAMTASKQRLDEQINVSDTRIKELISSLELNAQATIDKLSQFQQEAADHLHIIGSTGMAGDYQRVANISKRTSYFWQFVTVSSILGFIYFAITAYHGLQADKILWSNVGGRVFVAFAIGLLVAYAAKQAERYQENEVRNRRLQLELSSIDPYLANLDKETRDKVKVDLSQKLFGNVGSQGPTFSKEDKKVTGTSLDLVQHALTVVQDVLKEVFKKGN